MVVSKRKSLAGINGIPLEQDQYADSVVFGVSSRASIARGTVGKVLLPGGRVWNVGNILRKREYGGELFGSFVCPLLAQGRRIREGRLVGRRQMVLSRRGIRYKAEDRG